MSILADTSLDMATIGTESPIPSVVEFVKKPDTEIFDNLYTSHQEPYFMVSAPRNNPLDIPFDISSADDVNESWLSDIASGASDLYEKSKKKVTELFSDEKKPEQKTPETKAAPKPSTEPIEKKKEEKSSDVNLTEKSGGKDNIKELQRYFAKSSPQLKALIGNITYTGNIDGIVGPQTMKVSDAIEANLAKLINSNAVNGIVLKTNPADIDAAISKALSAKRANRIATFLKLS